MVTSSPSPPPVRVLHLMQDINSGGVERTHLSIIRGLPPPRWEHAVVCTRAVGPVAEAYAGLGVPVVETGPVRSVLSPGRYRQAARFVRAWRPHLLHGSINEGYVLGGVVGPLTRTPFLMEETSDPQDRRWKGHLLTRLMAGLADHAFGVSPAVGRYLTDTLRVPAHKVSVVNNGVPAPAPVAEGVVAELRASLKLGGQLVVGAVGRVLDDHKRFSDLLRALPFLADLPVVVLLVGDGPDLPALRAQAASMGVADRVRFVGFQGDPGPYYALMDVFTLPSQREAFGLVVAEAMRRGLPVVASRVGGVPDVVEEGVTGLLTPPLDPPSLAAALRDLLCDPERRAQMGTAGQERADRLFSEEQYVDEIRRLYERVLSRRPS